MIRRAIAAIGFGAVLLAVVPGSAGAQEEPPPPSGRRPLADTPEGCPIQELPDVVFVGTVVDSDFRTVRFRIDQHRAGHLAQFAQEALVDVRYGIDAKYLRHGDQFLVGASYNPDVGQLESQVQEQPVVFGEDEIIGASESERECPEVVDPRRTMHTDGRPVDSGLLSPMINDRQRLLGSLLLPLAAVCGAVFVLALIRWLLTGFGRGVESLARTSSQRPETRAAMRARQPAPATAGGQLLRRTGRQPPPQRQRPRRRRP